jgi:hypothetical protein
MCCPTAARVPGPGSRFQPEDVHGPSEVADPCSYEWRDDRWLVRPWHEALIYEFHIGAFTPEGTFRAAIAKLDHLTRLGVTALEIMPVADFPGRRNWGYDGVLLYAPDSSYGTPSDFKALILICLHWDPMSRSKHPAGPQIEFALLLAAMVIKPYSGRKLVLARPTNQNAKPKLAVDGPRNGRTCLLATLFRSPMKKIGAEVLFEELSVVELIQGGV